MDNKIILEALYEQRKLIITQNYKMMGIKTGFSEGYVYSVSHDIYPFFHIGEYHGIELYNDLYQINELQITEFINYIDKMWKADEKIGFYDLEDKYGGRSSRSDLINMLRYCYLENRFSGQEFWNYLMTKGPVECHNLTARFDDVYDL